MVGLLDQSLLCHAWPHGRVLFQLKQQDDAVLTALVEALTAKFAGLQLDLLALCDEAASYEMGFDVFTVQDLNQLCNMSHVLVASLQPGMERRWIGQGPMYTSKKGRAKTLIRAAEILFLLQVEPLPPLGLNFHTRPIPVTTHHFLS